jgi:hypothetical protein
MFGFWRQSARQRNRQGGKDCAECPDYAILGQSVRQAILDERFDESGQKLAKK